MYPHNGRRHDERFGDYRREARERRWSHGTHDPWRWDLSIEPRRSVTERERDDDYDTGQYGRYGGRYGAESPSAEERYVNLGETTMHYGDRGLAGEPHGGYNYNYERQHAYHLPRPQYVGKGPKGYVRTDERIREEVCERLSAGYMDASDIDVLVKDGTVTLSGTVHDRRTRRMAEALLDDISGINEVDNKLKIKAGPTTTDT